jgi:hypothetical protein
MKKLSAVVPLIILGLLIYFTNKLSLPAIEPIINQIPNAFFQKAIFVFFWLLPYLFLGLTLYGFKHMQKKNGLGKAGNFGFSGLITLFFVMLGFIFTRIVYSLFSFVGSAMSNLLDIETLNIGSNQNYLITLGLTAISIGLAVTVFFIYGIIEGKYRYKLHHHILHFPDLPESFNGFKITQISDIHAGSLENKNAVDKGIELINQQNSDMVLFTGDLVNNDASEFNPWKETFNKIRAPFGQFSVLGNHDYGDYKHWPTAFAKEKNRETIRNHHADIGFKLMQDEHIEIEKNGEKISLIGVQNWGHGFIKMGDLSKALNGIKEDSFKILMSHDPTHFEHEVKNHETKIHLTLSGHTHGMQMGIELPWFKWSPIKLRYKRWAGIYEENGRFININRGFGFLGFSGRVGIWPEITLIELRKTLS